MHLRAEADLAWAVIDAIGSQISRGDRADLHVFVGAGNSYLAITAALEKIAAASVSLPHDLITKLTYWIDAYAGSDDAPRLRQLLKAIGTLS